MSRADKRNCFASTCSHCTVCGKDLLETFDDYLTSVLVRSAPTGSPPEVVYTTKWPMCRTCGRLVHKIRPEPHRSGMGIEQLREAVEAMRQDMSRAYRWCRYHTGRETVPPDQVAVG